MNEALYGFLGPLLMGSGHKTSKCSLPVGHGTDPTRHSTHCTQHTRDTHTVSSWLLRRGARVCARVMVTTDVPARVLLCVFAVWLRRCER